LLTGLLKVHHEHNPLDASEEFILAFRRAKANLDPARALTAYLQIRKHLPAEVIPAHIHRDGAGMALTCRQTGIGLKAVAQAIEAGIEEGLPRLLERTEAVLRHALALPDAAEDVARLKAEVWGQMAEPADMNKAKKPVPQSAGTRI
jgi:hypothetical protein